MILQQLTKLRNDFPKMSFAIYFDRKANTKRIMSTESDLLSERLDNGLKRFVHKRSN